MNSINPQVGQWYLSRNGNIFSIIYDKRNVNPDTESMYPLLAIGKDGEDRCYTSEGKYYDVSTEDAFDLVEHLPDCTGFDYVKPTAKVLERVPMRLWFKRGDCTVICTDPTTEPDTRYYTELKLDDFGFYSDR